MAGIKEKGFIKARLGYTFNTWGFLTEAYAKVGILRFNWRI